MTWFCVRDGAARSLLWGLALGFLLAAGMPQARANEPILVQLDQARIIKIPDRATTVVIGNPLIADLSIQPGGLAVITGKSYGATNVIVMDHSGAVLAEETVDVRGPADQTVIVYRGVSRETYSCEPNCEPRITLGDDEKFFTRAINDTSTRNNAALAAGTGSEH